MRILNLTTNPRKYINPTIDLIDRNLRILDDVYNVDISSLTSETTVESLAARHGPFDLLVMKGGIFFHHKIRNQKHYLPDLFDCDLPILVLHMGDDLHGWRKDHGYAFDLLSHTRAFVLSSATSAQFFR